MHDLLNDPLIGIHTPARGDEAVNLPDLLALLSAGVPLTYTGLRAHQADVWHVFLVQVAASVMARHPSVKAPPTNAAFWREGLVDLADGQATAWQLIVDDVMKPALLQHPLTHEQDLASFKPKAATPDELDVLVTAKDHDVKAARMNALDPEAWLYALLTRQTSSGFLGAGNFGSVRMNGGFASRCIVSMVQGANCSARFIEELHMLQAMRNGTLAAGVGYASRGVVLTWIKPWKRTSAQWALKQLEPWFIEAVRPLRLRLVGNAITAFGTTSAERQVGPKSIDNGDIGDPWLPINANDKKKGRSALTVSASGWTPDLLCKLLFKDDIEATALQRPRPGMEGGAHLLGSVLVRGQGTTDGFHSFRLPVPARARACLFKPDQRDRLGKQAKELLGDAKEVERTLRAAVVSLAEGGPEKVDLHDDSLQAWGRAVVQGFTLGWPERFFPTLWQCVEADPQAVRAAWQRDLVERARAVLEEAQARVPLPSGRRLRAQVRARGFLESGLRRKGLIPTPPENAATDEEVTA